MSLIPRLYSPVFLALCVSHTHTHRVHEKLAMRLTKTESYLHCLMASSWLLWIICLFYCKEVCTGTCVGSSRFTS